MSHRFLILIMPADDGDGDLLSSCLRKTFTQAFHPRDTPHVEGFLLMFRFSPFLLFKAELFSSSSGYSDGGRLWRRSSQGQASR